MGQRVCVRQLSEPSDASREPRRCDARTPHAEMMRKTIASTIVSWNSVFSTPRRVRKLLLVPPPSAVPMPEPFAWSRITTVSTIATRIWAMLM